MKKPTILVIEDRYHIREILKMILSDSFNVLIRENGKAGIEAIMAHAQVQLVITDNEMPILDGFEVIKWIKFHQPHIPVIMMSGKDVKEKALKLGAAMFLEKPFQVQDNLTKIIRYFLDHNIS